MMFLFIVFSIIIECSLLREITFQQQNILQHVMLSRPHYTKLYVKTNILKLFQNYFLGQGKVCNDDC